MTFCCGYEFHPGSIVLPSSSLDRRRVLRHIKPTVRFISRFREERINAWNVFNTAPHISAQDATEICYTVFRQIFKVSTYIFIFVFVLGLVIISKGSLLVATSKLRPHPDTNATSKHWDLACSDYKKQYNNSLSDNITFPRYKSGNTSFTLCVSLPRRYDVQQVDNLSCIAVDTSSHGVWRHNESLPTIYLADECVVTRIYWAWSILLMICSPYVFVFCRCLWIVIFRNKMRPEWKVLGCVLVVETLHCVGLCLLVFLVLPSLDNVVQGLMVMLGVALIPSSLKILVRPKEEKQRNLKIVFDGLAIAAQFSVLIVWPIATAIDDAVDNTLSKYAVVVPFSLALVSVRWWENYFDNDNSHLGNIRRPLSVLAGKIRRSRTKIQLVASVWKIAVSIVMMMICVGLQIDEMDHERASFTNTFTAVFNFDLG